MSDFVMPLDKMPDGHIKARMEEIKECIRTDTRHLEYLKGEYFKFWCEKGKREGRIEIILISSGKFTIVDKEDLEKTKEYNWYYDGKYAASMTKGRTATFLHRLINQTPQGFDTDHINQNKLDNRKCNLRTTTRTMNMLNTPLPKHNTSGEKGVYYNKNMGSINKWYSQITISGKTYNLGSYATIKEAKEARDMFKKERGII